jgi:hypothetical protein
VVGLALVERGQVEGAGLVELTELALLLQLVNEAHDGKGSLFARGSIC